MKLKKIMKGNKLNEGPMNDPALKAIRLNSKKNDHNLSTL